RRPPPDLRMSDAEECRGQSKEHAGDDRPSEHLLLAAREPLARVAPHVAIPEVDERFERDVLEARTAEVLRLRLGHHPDFFSCRGQTAAVVDVLEPGRKKLF